jgi:AcrR family transcriptional regulator
MYTGMTKAAQHKDALIQAAATLFRERGYSATGLNEILKQSGAPKGSLYYYFPGGKEALGEAAVTLAGKVVSKTLRELQSKTESAGEFLQQYSELLAGWMDASEFRAGCPIATTILETCPESASMQQAGIAVFEKWIQIVSEVYMRDGQDEPQARASAQLVIAALEGALLLSRAYLSVKPIHNVFSTIHSTF